MLLMGGPKMSATLVDSKARFGVSDSMRRGAPAR